MTWIQKSTSFTYVFKAYLSSDHVTPATGKTIAITISKNTAAYGNPSAGSVNATEISNGTYYVTISTTDTNTNGPLALLGTCSGVDQIDYIWLVGVAPANVLQFLSSASVGAAGYVGIDWSQINAPTSSVALSNTTIGLTAAAELAIWEIQTSVSPGAGTYGQLFITNLDTNVGSRLATSGYTAPDNADISTILTDVAALIVTIGTPVSSIAADIANQGSISMGARYSNHTRDDALKGLLTLFVGKKTGLDTGSIIWLSPDGAHQVLTGTGDAYGNYTPSTFAT